MSNSNGVISAPVSIDDVKAVLGESSNDLATLCTSSNINMWSKYKPVRLATNFPDLSGTWYRADDGDLGIQIGKGATTNLGTLYAGASFTYKRPGGGSSQPYRLGDFVGYNQNAKPFLYNESLGGTATIDMFSGGVSSDLYQIKKGDISLYDYGTNHDMCTGYLIVRCYTCSSESYNPANLSLVCSQSNDTSHQIGAGYTYIVSPAASENTKLLNALADYTTYSGSFKSAVLMFFAIQSNSGNVYPLYVSGTPYIKLYAEYKLFAGATGGISMYRLGSVGLSGNPFQNNGTVSISTNSYSNICFYVAFRTSATVSGTYTFYSKTSYSSLSGTHRFRLVKFYASSNGVQYVWYPDIYNNYTTKVGSLDVTFSSSTYQAFILNFDREYVMGITPFSTMSYGTIAQYALQYSGDGGSHWMNVNSFNVYYH